MIVEDPEPSRALGDASDRHSCGAREGCGVQAHSVRTEGTLGAAAEAPTLPRPKSIRVRRGDRRVPGHDPNSMGITRPPGTRDRTDANQGAWTREPRPARRDRPALA